MLQAMDDNMIVCKLLLNHSAESIEADSSADDLQFADVKYAYTQLVTFCATQIRADCRQTFGTPSSRNVADAGVSHAAHPGSFGCIVPIIQQPHSGCATWR